jgi:beta-glucanase (GH16 family)
MTIEPPGITSAPGAPCPDSGTWASPKGRPLSNMKRTLLQACLILLATSAQAQTWHLTWADEFNAPNGTPPDPAKWNIVTGGKGFGNNELETYTARPANIQQQDGNLVITARKEDLIGPDGVARNYTSARINTASHFAQKYGRFEARIKLPSGKGIWPAFWLLGDDHETNHWPNCGEIDILETIGSPTTMYSTIHGPGYSASKGPSTKFNLPANEQVDTAFHLYAVEWSPNDLKFFFDDHLIVERTPADLPPDTHWVYDHPFYVLLNFAVGGNWPGNPDATTAFPQQMLVDYVRVYSLDSATKPGGPSFASFAKGGLSREARPFSIRSTPSSKEKPDSPQHIESHVSASPEERPLSLVPATKPGAPYLDSEMWASSEGRPLSSPSPSPYTTATTVQAQP